MWQQVSKNELLKIVAAGKHNGNIALFVALAKMTEIADDGSRRKKTYRLEW